jgi:ABC-2 type transport system ATP-binding protein
MNIIETENLTRRFGRVAALEGVNLTVPEGSIFALLGPNGAGKTTLLETLLNVLKPSMGIARVLGCDSRSLGAEQLSQIGYVSENLKVDDQLKVGALLAFVRKLYPTWDHALEKKLTDTFDLPLDRRFRHLSRGMRIRVLFVAALAFRPKVLVLDEPFSGLDPLMRDDLVTTVLDLAAEDKRTILLASHDVEEVERISDRVAFMEAGHVTVADSIEALCARHLNVVVRVSAGVAPTIAKRDSWLGFRAEGDVISFVSTQARSTSEAGWESAFGPEAAITTAPLSLKEIYLAHARASLKRKD